MTDQPKDTLMDLEHIFNIIGRKPTEIELEIISQFYLSFTKSFPVAGLKNIFKHGKNHVILNKNVFIVTEVESKNSMIGTSLTRTMHAYGVRPMIKIKSEYSNMGFGISRINNILNYQVTGVEEIIFIHDGKGLRKFYQQLRESATFYIRKVDPCLLANELYKIFENKFGIELEFSSKDQISILSNAKTHGVLLAIHPDILTIAKKLLKNLQLKFHHLGHLKPPKFLTVNFRHSTKAHLTTAVLNISPLPQMTLNPVVEKKLELKPATMPKELKNYNEILLHIWQLIKKQNLKQLVPFHTNEEFAVCTPESDQYLETDLINGTRIMTTNAIRELVCNGYKPLIASMVIHGIKNQSNNSFWKIQEVYKNTVEALQHFNIVPAIPSVTFNNYSKIKFEFCVAGKKLKTIYPEKLNQFSKENDFITLLGSHRGELFGSLYQRKILNLHDAGQIPTTDFMIDSKIIEVVIQGVETGLIHSAMNISAGGLAIALAKSLYKHSNPTIGARIHISRKLRQDEILFGETQGLVVVTIGEKDLMEFERICMTIGVPSTTIGRVTMDGCLKFNDVIKINVNEL